MTNERYITRTMKSNNVSVTVLNKESMEVEEHYFSYDGPMLKDDDRKLYKMACNALETPTIKVIEISHQTVEENVYRLSETEFKYYGELWSNGRWNKR